MNILYILLDLTHSATCHLADPGYYLSNRRKCKYRHRGDTALFYRLVVPGIQVQLCES